MGNPGFLGAIGAWWITEGWPWISAWMQTSGFGGAAAVVAATLAFMGVRRQTRLNAWWQRAEWALDLITRADATDEQVETGLVALGALQKSRLAKTDEQNFLAGIATSSTLDPIGDGALTDDLAPAPPDAPSADAEGAPATLRARVRRILDVRNWPRGGAR